MKENKVTNTKASKTSHSLQIIGQEMHIMNPRLIRAIEEQDGISLAAMAKKQMDAGAHALDLNLGPAKTSKKKIQWAVETIQSTVNAPLFISSHVLSQPEILDMHQGRATINSVTADPAPLAGAMEKAGEHGADLVVLLVRPGLTPFTVDERLQLALEVLETATRVEFPLTNLYLDPLFHFRPDPMTWHLSRGLPDIQSVLETIEMLPQLTGEKIRTVAALSSASQFLHQSERSSLHQRLLPMLIAAGLNAIIMNCHDKKLMEIARDANVGLEHDLPPLPHLKANFETVELPW